MITKKPSEKSPTTPELSELTKQGFADFGDYAPWADDPDPPAEDLTDEELQKMSDGFAELLKKTPKWGTDDSGNT